MRFYFFTLIKVIYIIRLMWLRKAVLHPGKPGWVLSSPAGRRGWCGPFLRCITQPYYAKGNWQLPFGMSFFCAPELISHAAHRISTAVLKGLKEGTQGFRPTPRGFDFFSQKCFDRKYFLPCNLKAWNLPEQSVPSTQTWQNRMFNKYMFLFT